MAQALLLYKLSLYGLVEYSLVQLWWLRRTAAAAAYDQIAKETKRFYYQNMVASVIIIAGMVLVMMFLRSPVPHAVWLPLRCTHDSLISLLVLLLVVWRWRSERLRRWRVWYYDALTTLYVLVAVSGAELVRELPLVLA